MKDHHVINSILAKRINTNKLKKIHFKKENQSKNDELKVKDKLYKQKL